MAKMIRIQEETDLKLKSLSKQLGQSKQQIINQAIEKFAREKFHEKANQAYADLRKDKKSWKEFQHDREEWDVVLNDGREDD